MRGRNVASVIFERLAFVFAVYAAVVCAKVLCFAPISIVHFMLLFSSWPVESERLVMLVVVLT